MAQQVALLAFEHFQVFAEDPSLAFANALGERLVVGLEVARHAPEVPDGSGALRGDEVDHDARRLALRRRLVAAVAGVGHADLDQHVAGRREAADLPAVHRHVVGQAVAAQSHAPERRGHDILHVAAGDHLVAFHPRGRRGLVDFLLADAGRMDIGLVGQVHQVIDHQAIVAVDVVQPAAIGPIGAFRPFQAGYQRGVGLFFRARPDPDEAVPFLHREATDAGEAADPLAGHRAGATVLAHCQAVVAADQHAVLDEAQRQRRATVRAEILEGRHAAVLASVENHRLVADASAERLAGQFVGGAGHVPGVLRKHRRILSLFL